MKICGMVDLLILIWYSRCSYLSLTPYMLGQIYNTYIELLLFLIKGVLLLKMFKYYNRSLHSKDAHNRRRKVQVT
jgi:hypothetical protein